MQNQPWRPLGSLFIIGVAVAILAVLVSSAATPTVEPLGISTPGCQGVDILDDLACLVGGPDGLQVLRIANPGAPELVGTAPLEQTARAVALVGHYAYVAARYNGLLVYDLADPALPRLAAQLELEGYAEDVTIAGGYAYVAAEWGGLRIIDIQDPCAPREVASVRAAQPAMSVAIQDAWAYVACGKNGLVVVDLATPSIPSQAGHCALPDTASDVCVAGERAYVANLGGVVVVDIAQPAAPAPLARLDLPGWAMAVDLSGPYALLAEAHQGLRLIDATVSEALKPVAIWPVEGYVNDVRVVGETAYLATSDGLRTFQVRGNYAPTVEGDAARVVSTQVGEWIEFTTTFRDLNGWADLDRVALLINSTLDEKHACYLVYDLRANLLGLVDDTGQGLAGQASPGDEVIVTNGQVALDCQRTRLGAPNDTDLTITWRLRFTPARIGAGHVHLYAVDIDASASGWVVANQFLLNPARFLADPAMSALPPGQGRGYELSYRHANGWKAASRAHWQLRPVADADGGDVDVAAGPVVHLVYDQNTDTALLMDAAGREVAAQGQIGGDQLQYLENELLVVDLARCLRTGDGDYLNVRWWVTFKDALSGQRYHQVMRLDGDEGGEGSWGLVGECTINRAPMWGRADPVKVEIPANEWVQLTTTFLDPDGWQQLHDGLVLINQGLDERQACYLHYQLDGQAITLFDDDGQPMAGRGAAGEALILENSQVSVDLAETAAQGEGNELTITWKLRFDEGFAGTRYVHLQARDRARCSSGWTTAGWLQITESPSQTEVDESAVTPEAPPNGATLPPWPGTRLWMPPQPLAVRLAPAADPR